MVLVVSVLVLEAGPLYVSRNPPDLNWQIAFQGWREKSFDSGGLLPVPGKIGSGGWQKYQWGLTTEPQTYLNNPKVGIPQGKAVGGSSILNGLCWSRGSVSDYDGWEKLGKVGKQGLVLEWPTSLLQKGRCVTDPWVWGWFVVVWEVHLQCWAS